MSVTNRVFKVLATTGGAAAANVAALTAGKWIVLKKDGTAFAAADTIAAGDTFTVAVGSPSGAIVYSDPFAIKDITSYEKQVFRAKVEQVVTVVADTPVVGAEYSLLINDKSDKEILPCRQNIRRYTVLATTGETAATIAAKFIAKINADPASIVTASGTGANIVLTADAVANTANLVGEYYDQYFFEVAVSQADLYGYFTPWGTVTYTTAADFGSGNFYQVRKLEQRGIGYTGVTNRMLFPVETGDFTSVAGTNYDVYVIEQTNRHESGLYTIGQVKAPISLIIAVTAGQGTALEAILTPLIGSAPNEALTVEG